MRKRTPKAVAAALALIVVLVGCDRVTRITASTYQDSVRCFAPSLSGDASVVSFTSLDDPSGVTTPQSTVRRELASGASTKLAGQPSSVGPNGTSGDGSRVVFTISFSDGGLGAEDRAYLWTSRSKARTRISPLGDDVGSLVISPDGRKVAYTTGNHQLLWLHDVGTGARRAIARPAGTPTTAQWSDLELSGTGRYLVLRRIDAPGLHVLDLQGTGSWSLLTGEAGASGVSAPSTSDDGRFVVWSLSEPASFPSSFVWDRTTGSTRSISSGEVDLAPVISGDGTTIALVRPSLGSRGGQVVLRDRASGRTRVAVSANDYVTNLSISRDGKAVAFCSQATNLAGGPQAPNLFLWRG